MTDIQRKNLTTEELLKILQKSRTRAELDTYTSQLPEQCGFSSFAEYLFSYLREHDIVESDLIRASQIQRNYAYQVLNGTKNPGRDKVLALCLAAQMNYEETQRALALANLGKLYPRKHKDSIVIFALEQNLSVQQTNELLFESGEEILA